MITRYTIFLLLKYTHEISRVEKLIKMSHVFVIKTIFMAFHQHHHHCREVRYFI